MEHLVGKKIIEVRQMTEEEVEYEGWPGPGDDTVLVLDDGTRVYASCDPEGNMPGALFVRPKAETVYQATVYFTLDEDDLHASLEYVEIVSAETHKMYDHEEIAVACVERDSVSFETTSEAVAREYGHHFVEMLLPGAEEPVPTPWAREHTARIAVVKVLGDAAKTFLDAVVAEFPGVENESKRADVFESRAKSEARS
jgi:hypothetical protein